MERAYYFIFFHAGKLPVIFRTPPVNPPKQNYLTRLRRACSLEFRPHLLHSQDPGLADPLLGSIGSFGTSERPRSCLFNWNRGHFSRPLLTVHENEDGLAIREQKEKIAFDGIAKWQHSCMFFMIYLCSV